MESFRFTWTIEHFSTWKKKHYSEIFTVGGYKWRVIIFPKGKGVDQLSLFLEVADSATLPSGWSKFASFILSVVSQIHPYLTLRKETHHIFNAKESDSGYKSFIPLCDVHDPTKGYVVDDTLIVEAEVIVRRMVDYCWAYDSRQQTEFVGMKNQGTTGQSEAVSPSRSSETVDSRFENHERIQYTREQLLQLQEASVNLSDDIHKAIHEIELKPVIDESRWGRTDINASVNLSDDIHKAIHETELKPVIDESRWGRTDINASVNLFDDIHKAIHETELKPVIDESRWGRTDINAAGGKSRQVGLHGREREGEGLLERPEQCKRVEGTCEGESLIVQHRGSVPEAPRGIVGEVMTVEQIANVLGDISWGLVPTDLEDPRWPSSAGGMTQTFAPMVRLADEFRALKREVERLRTKEAILSEVMRLLDRGQGGSGS